MAPGLFCFFIPGEKKQILPGHRLWDVPLSGGKNESPPDNSSLSPHLNTVITIGDYFSAAREVLLRDTCSLLQSGLMAFQNDPHPIDHIGKICIFLEKHGALYHPLKIQVLDHLGGSNAFVLNGAVSRSGLSLINTEYQLISRLNNACTKQYLPRVFGIDSITTDKGEIGFFLGEWFDGYKEFHVTRARGKEKIVLWESDGTCQDVSDTAALEIYREISRILTGYYNLETFEQIFPWHHAAGDFIVNKVKSRFQVRLITVRGYRSLTEFDAQAPDKKVHILPSLLLFFLNLTVRVRLDRLDGTGKAVLLGENVIPAIVEGFLKGLEEKSIQYDYGDLRFVFKEFFKQFSLKQVTAMIENILESYPVAPSEQALVKENLDRHCRRLHAIFRKI